jgi:hypothetical protein
MRTTRMIAVAVTMLSLLYWEGCGKSKGDGEGGPDNNGQLETGNGPAVSTAAGEIREVQTNMVPGSLEVAQREGENPCEGLGLIACQPNLLKVYLANAQRSVGTVQNFLSQISSAMSRISVPGEGSINVPMNGQTMTILYKATTRTKYSLLFKNVSTPILSFKADDKHYVMTMRTGKNGSSDPAQQFVMVIDISYQSPEEFHVETKFHQMPCTTDDTRAPNNYVSVIDVADGVWKGKAMMMSYTWLGGSGDSGPLCSDDPSTSGMSIYTDFVADDSYASASLYMMPWDVATVEALVASPVRAFCTTFSGKCSDGVAFGSSISSLGSIFCISRASGAASWTGPCTSSSSADVASGSFGDASDWIVPDVLRGIDPELPSVPE